MPEARLNQGSQLKMVLENSFLSLKDLLNEATWIWSASGIEFQATSKCLKALVSVSLSARGFDFFDCKNELSMGLDLNSFAKILNCVANDDIITIKAKEQTNNVTFIISNQQKVSDDKMKLPNLDQGPSGIVETDIEPLKKERLTSEYVMKSGNLGPVDYLSSMNPNYSAVVTMPGNQFKRIITDLSQFGQLVTISCSEGGVTFSAADNMVTGKAVGCITLSGIVPSTTIEKAGAITIRSQEPITLKFASRYLKIFAQASCLSPRVSLSIHKKGLLAVKYQNFDLFNDQITYYLSSQV